MKKLLSAIICGTFVLVGGSPKTIEVNASEQFNLIEYCETHEITSRQEFQDILDLYVGNQNENDPTDEEGLEVSFDVEIDYENQIVITTTVYEYDSLRGSTSGSASKDYYNSNGTKIFTVTVNGSFTFGSGSAHTTSASGSFSPVSGSGWSSTPTISSGTSGSSAYATASGTARKGAQSMNYTVTLICSSTGNLSSC